jgi:acyl-coenzyme A synthetase/AMP-(fatty) acid ligase
LGRDKALSGHAANSVNQKKHTTLESAIPRNATGKILRRELRNPYWEGRDPQVS